MAEVPVEMKGYLRQMHDDHWKQPTKDALALLRWKYSDAFLETQD